MHMCVLPKPLQLKGSLKWGYIRRLMTCVFMQLRRRGVYSNLIAFLLVLQWKKYSLPNGWYNDNITEQGENLSWSTCSIIIMSCLQFALWWFILHVIDKHVVVVDHHIITCSFLYKIQSCCAYIYVRMYVYLVVAMLLGVTWTSSSWCHALAASTLFKFKCHHLFHQQSHGKSNLFDPSFLLWSTIRSQFCHTNAPHTLLAYIVYARRYTHKPSFVPNTPGVSTVVQQFDTLHHNITHGNQMQQSSKPFISYDDYGCF